MLLPKMKCATCGDEIWIGGLCTTCQAVENYINNKVKQVIVIRKDLKMRRGKEIAQGSHASLSFLVHKLYHNNEQLSDVEKMWLDGPFTKICVCVNTEVELFDIKAKADEAGLVCHLITDAGQTEFNLIPTNTCLAIGPDYSDKIDKITGNLKLY